MEGARMKEIKNDKQNDKSHTSQEKGCMGEEETNANTQADLRSRGQRRFFSLKKIRRRVDESGDKSSGERSEEQMYEKTIGKTTEKI